MSASDILAAVRISDVYHALTGMEARSGRVRAPWRETQDRNVSLNDAKVTCFDRSLFGLFSERGRLVFMGRQAGDSCAGWRPHVSRRTSPQGGRPKMIHSYPWYIADWRSSEAVMSMSLEERGLYREMLDHCWEAGSLPADETILRKIAQVGEREWRRAWPKVRQQFHEREGRLWHPKVDEKWPGLEEWHRSRREAGRVGGLKRWGKFDDSLASSLATGSTTGSVNGSATSKPVAVLKPSSSSSSFTTTTTTTIQPPPTPPFPETNTDETQTSPDSPSLVRPVVPAADTFLEGIARRIHDRHPQNRRCGVAEIQKHLNAILKKVPGAERASRLTGIDQRHAGWCSSEAWTKENGQYAKGLANWLAPTMGRFDEQPPEEDDPTVWKGNVFT